MVNGRNETHFERCDRNSAELLQEVRVAQTAVQVMLGFLVAVAFTARFRTLSTFQRVDYLATLLAAGLGAIFLIAPASYHRILFRLGDKEHIVDAANRLVILGLAAVASALVGVSVLVADLLFGVTVTIAMGGATIIACSVTWYILPLARRRLIRAKTNGTTGTVSPSLHCQIHRLTGGRGANEQEGHAGFRAGVESEVAPRTAETADWRSFRIGETRSMMMQGRVLGTQRGSTRTTPKQPPHGHSAP